MSTTSPQSSALSHSPLVLPPGLVAPRQATARNSDRATYGAHRAATAAALGKPLLPWQRYVADVAGEVDEDGVFVYSTIVLTVQRQAGKTTLDLADSTSNALQGSNRRSWYTADTGAKATEKWREMVENDWSVSPLHGLTKKTRMSNGSETLTLYNGSTFRPHPPTKDSLHSKQVDKATVDEAWSFTEAEGAALFQAIGGAQSTRHAVTGQRPQTWIESTEGTIESTWFNALLDRCRAGDPSIAFFDWGIGPDDDPTDLDLVLSKHPGYPRLLTRDTLVDQLGLMGPGEFARAYGNRRTGATERVIPAPAWAAAEYRDTAHPEGPLAIGAAVGVDNADATVAVAVRSRAGGIVVAIVPDGHGPGSGWALDRIKALHAETGAPIAIDRVGPSAALHDEVRRAELPMVEITAGSVTAAASNMLAWITNTPHPLLRHRQHAALDAAAELATRRWISDGAWTWGRRASVGSISPIEAVTLAAWGVDHLPEEMGLQIG